MIYRFAAFELDEGRRELRLAGRELLLQPRVFDLLLYLVRHRHRVISKDELLDTLWPRMVVTEGSLQRAISLVRSALRQGGAGEAIRTHARQGYRFCEAVNEDSPPADAAIPDADPSLLRARTHHAQRQWTEALAAFASADHLEALTGADLERWADAAQWSGQSAQAIEPLQRAVAANAAAGDRRGAARACLLLARINTELLNPAVAQGWLRQSGTYLAGLPECREHGLHAWLCGHMSIDSGEMEATARLGAEALAIGRRLDDSDLECLGLALSGLAYTTLGRLQEGGELQDQAAALVLTSDASPWVGGLVFCEIIFCCKHQADWARAAEWSEQFTRWCERHNLGAFPGTCRVHRAEILGIRGQLDAAEQEVREACQFLASGAPWAEGEGWRILGDLCLARERLDDAREAYHRAHACGWEPLPGLALLQAASGQPALALRTLQRALAGTAWTARQRRGELLAHLATIACEAGELAIARDALNELDSAPVLWPTPALRGLRARAHGELALREGRHMEAIAAMREATAHWRAIGAPLEAARTQVRLATCLLADQDPEAAAMELAATAAWRERAGLRVLNLPDLVSGHNTSS